MRQASAGLKRHSVSASRPGDRATRRATFRLIFKSTAKPRGQRSAFILTRPRGAGTGKATPIEIVRESNRDGEARGSATDDRPLLRGRKTGPTLLVPPCIFFDRACLGEGRQPSAHLTTYDTQHSSSLSRVPSRRNTRTTHIPRLPSFSISSSFPGRPLSSSIRSFDSRVRPPVSRTAPILRSAPLRSVPCLLLYPSIYILFVRDRVCHRVYPRVCAATI